MQRDLAAWVETQVDLRTNTLPSTTIIPSRDGDLDRAVALLEQMAGTSLLASVQLRPGAVIGEGGMGIVREAEQVALGRTVAVKTLRDGMRTPEAARDLLREAWVTGSLEHPNVVPVHHLGLDADGLPALVLKRVEGVDWSRLLRDAPEVTRRYGATDLLAWNLSIMMQVLNAIRFAHSRGIVHRDLKPSNIMIGDFGEVYLLDWGIAVSLRDDGKGRLPLARDATSIAGTPCYMAPEMLARDGDAPLSERTDVYLAGAVLFEIVTGHPPHQGKTALEVLTSVVGRQPEVPDEVAPELAAVITRAMDPDPVNRFESAETLRLALQRYLEHRGSDQLVARARVRLDELAAILARPPEDQLQHREDVHRLFGACRFGFHEALAAWHDNTAARAGLRRATIAVAEYELAIGDAHAALSLLSELEDPPALLEHARQQATQQATRRQQLERLGHAHDLQVGTRQRGRLATTLGAFFTLTPILSASVPALEVRSYWRQVTWSLFFAIVTAVWAWLARSTLAATLVNRRLIGAIMFLFIGQALLVASMWSVGVPVAQTQVLMIFNYFVVAGVVAMTVDARMVPTAIGFGVMFGLATLYPDLRLYFMGAGNFILTLNSYYAWLHRSS